MFKYSAIFIFIVSIFLSVCLDTVAARQKRTRDRYPHSILDFHLGVWDSTDGDSGIGTHYTYDPRTGEQVSDVSLSGLGGFLAYTHRLNRRFAWEFSIGGFTQAEMITSSKFKYTSIYQDYYQQVTLVPISFSAFFYPFAIDFPLQPYVSGGIGPYGGVESITEENSWNGSEPIDVNILIALGRFLGGGVDFFLNKHFGFNIDFRYQQVEFHKPIGGMKKYSGPQLTWGFKVAF